MNVEIQYRVRSNPNDIKYLREKSYWYKFLNRNKNYFKQFEEEMKKEYKLTPEDKINKMANSINMLSKFIDILQ